MGDGSENVACRMWFNSHLFFIDHQPLKFYLLGYDQLECRNIVRIIEAYGGKLSAPDGETTVFSEPHRFTDYDGDLYHIKCLYDSIMMNQLQDVSRYRLFSTQRAVSPISPDIPSSPRIQDNQIANSSNSLLLKCKEEPHSDIEIDWEMGETYVKIQDFLDHTSQFCESTLENSKPNTDKSSPSTSYNISRPWEDNKERIQTSKPSTNQQNSSGIDDFCTAESTAPYLSANKFLKCSENIPIEKNSKENAIISSARRSRKMEFNGELREVLSSRRNVKRHSYEEIPTDISSSEEMAESKRHNRQRRKKIPSTKRYLKPINSKGKTPSSVKSSRYFTEEEDRQIIKYLIDNNAISSATGHGIWKHVEAAMPNTSRSGANLRHRYIAHLRYNYAKYTDDPKALVEFAANVARKQEWKPKNIRTSSFLSDQDMKKLVDYLISSDVFSHAFRKMIWQDVITKQILESPLPSWYRVYSSFRWHVLPVIDKYVDDPEIMEKFRVLQSRMANKREFRYNFHPGGGGR